MPTFWISLSKKYHTDLFEIAVEISKNKDEFLFLEGQPFRGFYVVNYGRFRIFNGNKSGNEATISIIEAGSVISAVPILAELPTYHADCQALEQSSITFFPKDKFISLMLKYPGMTLEFTKLVSIQFLKIREKYLSLILKNAEERFMDFLSKSNRHTNYAELTVSKKNIASLLDITPESLSRIIKKLVITGKIDIQQNKIKILWKT